MGEHKGFWYHTVGQRQGIGLSGGAHTHSPRHQQTLALPAPVGPALAHHRVSVLARAEGDAHRCAIPQGPGTSLRRIQSATSYTSPAHTTTRRERDIINHCAKTPALARLSVRVG